MSIYKKKILFINGHLNIGGVEKSLIDLLSTIDYAKFDVDLLLLEEKGDYLTQLPKDINLIYRDTRNSYGPLIKTIWNNLLKQRYSDILYRIIILLTYCSKKGYWFLTCLLHVSNHYDIAIAYRPGVCTEILAYAIDADKKYSWWHHGECDYNNIKMIKEINRTWSSLTGIVTVSNACKKMLRTVFSYPNNKIHIIPNLIDSDKIQELANEPNPYVNNVINIVTVGRLSKEKHIGDIVDVCERLVSDGIVNFHWNIIGDGDLYDDIHNRIYELNMDSYITMHGKKENPYPYIKYADILVHPSHVESQCITVLEAMALKTPCVVCRSLGPSEYIVSNVDGILTEPNVDSLTKGVRNMIKLLPNSNYMVENAYKMVVENYSEAVIIDKFKRLI